MNPEQLGKKRWTPRSNKRRWPQVTQNHKKQYWSFSKCILTGERSLDRCNKIVAFWQQVPSPWCSQTQKWNVRREDHRASDLFWCCFGESDTGQRFPYHYSKSVYHPVNRTGHPAYQITPQCSSATSGWGWEIVAVQPRLQTTRNERNTNIVQH